MTAQPTPAQLSANDAAIAIGRQIGLAWAAKRAGDDTGQKNHAEAAMENLKKVELNYENLDWRQLAEGDAQMLLGNMEAAEKAYRQAMVAAPQESGGFQRLGELLQQMGRTDDLTKHLELCVKKFPNMTAFLKIKAVAEAANQNYQEAIPTLAQAFAINKDDHEIADALGTCLQNINQYDEAVLYHSHALQLDPANAGYAIRYGLAFMGANEHEAAAECFRYAISLEPMMIDAYAYLGYELQREGKLDEAEDILKQGLSRDPGHSNLNFFLGRLYQERGDKAAAIQHFDTTVGSGEKEADTARFLSAAVKGETPEHPPEKFVTGLFDFYAPTFESSLLKELQYRAPHTLYELLVSAEVKAARDITATPQRILDLGCGTGLVGQILKPHASQLVGVDLSGNMLIRANEKGIYDLTKREDILKFVQESSKGQYDLVTAADVFIYVGNLAPIISALSEKLESGALLAFSCEKLPEDAEGPGYALRSTVRYAQKDSYIRNLASSHGFKVVAVNDSPVHQQKGEAIEGLHYVLVKQ